MFRLCVLALALLVAPAHAACPDYLDLEMRRLHSAQSVNLCEVIEGRPVLIINTASHCGFTPQFKGLEALHQRYGERLAILGFASNDFYHRRSRDIC